MIKTFQHIITLCAKSAQPSEFVLGGSDDNKYAPEWGTHGTSSIG